MDMIFVVCYIKKGESMKKEMNNETKINKAVFHTGEVLTLIIITCIVSLLLGWLVTTQYFKSNTVDINDDSYIDSFIENYQYILDNYYGEIDKDKLIKGALNGMLSALDDDYSILMDESTADNFNIQLKGNYEGIGVEIYKYNNQIIILDVFDESPADKAGLKPGDIIVSVDGNIYTDVSDISSYIRTSKKDTFKMTILRDSQEQTITLNRSYVTIPSVSSKIYNQNGKKIGYIYIGIFANATTEQFKEHLKQLEDDKIDSLIIDVRSNSGGHLTTAVSILSVLLDKTHVIYQTDTKGKIEKFYSDGSQTKTYPIVVLQNESSASASELLSITLQEEYGATVIGMTSYGKGTVQELVNNGDIEYKFTTKKWLSPKGNWIHEKGVVPDIVVEMDEVYSDEPNDANDNQLQRALNYLSS